MREKAKALRKRAYQALSYSKEDEAIDKADRRKTWGIYLACLKPSWKYILIYVFLILLDVALEIMVPFMSGLLIRCGLEGYGALTPEGIPQPLIVGGGLNQPAMSQVWLYGGIMIACAFVAIFVQSFGMKLIAIVSSDFVERLRNTIFGKAEELSFSNIARFPVSKLTTMLSNDCNNIRFFVLMFIRMGAKQSFMIIFCFVFIFSLNWLIGLITVPLTIIAFVLILWIIKKTRPEFIMTQTAIDYVNRDVEEDTEGVREVKAFCREQYMDNKFGEANENLTYVTYSSVSKMGLTTAITTFAINVTIGLIQLFGGFSMINTSLSDPLWQSFNNGLAIFDAGELSMLTSFAALLTLAFSYMSMLFQYYGRAEASKERIDRLLSERIDITYDPKEKTADFDPDSLSSGEVEFDNVVFSYVGDRNKRALGPISFKVREGMTIGIVGGTGAGKSSLVNLIPRLYDPTEGSVKIGGHDVRDYSLQALRNDIGVVLQNNLLFTGTIRSNIQWGKKGASDAEIYEALDIAQASDFVNSFADKLSTPVTQGGRSVSGGQKQRLCIARAVIKKPKILILDDSTSACDTDTSARIHRQLREKLIGTTVFLIAQRIDSVKDCDLILVLDNGALVGEGTHDELMKTCTIYREIEEIQRKGVD